MPAAGTFMFERREMSEKKEPAILSDDELENVAGGVEPLPYPDVGSSSDGNTKVEPKGDKDIPASTIEESGSTTTVSGKNSGGKPAPVPGPDVKVEGH